MVMYDFAKMPPPWFRRLWTTYVYEYVLYTHLSQKVTTTSIY